MKNRIVFYLLVTVCCAGFQTALCAKTYTDTTSRDSAKFCLTGPELKFYLLNVQRAKEYRAENIMLNTKLQADSAQSWIQEQQVAEYQAQLRIKEGLIGTANAKTAIVQGQSDAYRRQRNRWRLGCFSVSVAFLVVGTYLAVK